MVFDWIAREGAWVLVWWLLATAAGLIALPVCVRLLGGLPDKGYTLARAAGLLLIGYIYWLLGSLGFLRNSSGSIVLAALVTLGLSVLVYLRGRRFDWRGWWRANRPVIVTAEVLFFVLLVGWSLVRAHQNELYSTEKPMDLMFLSSIVRSPAFPPNDGWLSGYSISYYYFGYFIAAMFTTLSGVVNTASYNLMTAMIFALAGLTGFGVVYNLVRSRIGINPQAGHRSALLTGLLGVLLLIFMGNWQVALVEFPYQTRTASEAYLRFTGTQNREVYPERLTARDAGTPDSQPVTFRPGEADPLRWGSWWWFRASRVLNDYDLNGAVMPNWYAQPIDEFPQFSFLLADNHPHVSSLPFVLLAIGLALNLALTGRRPSAAEVLFYGLCLGGLVFLNTWDGPIYLVVMIGADAIRRLQQGQGRLTFGDGLGMLALAGILGVLIVIFYLPFLISFRSQAAGLLPNVITPTFLPQFIIMFGPFLVILALFLGLESWRAGWRMNWGLGFQVSGVILILLLVVMLGLILVGLFVPEVYGSVIQFASQYGGLGAALPLILQRRLETLPTTLLILFGLVVIAARLFPRLAGRKTKQGSTLLEDDAGLPALQAPTGTAFALLVCAAGLGLVLVPEFFYLRDNFSTRINTIFKFYYQAWVLFSVASAYGVYALFADESLRPGMVFRLLSGAATLTAIGMGMLYPLFGIPQRMFIETGIASSAGAVSLTLDGGRTLTAQTDYLSIQCWMEQVSDRNVVVAEALGPAYNSNYGRVAGLTGAPIVMGWANHQRQWRGPTYGQVAGSREQDIPALYTDVRWETAVQIIKRYGIDYIFYGVSERDQYSSVGEEKFIENLVPMCPITDLNGRIVSVFYRVAEDRLQAVSN